MVPVLLGMMGFAVDLGRLYLVRGELNQAASAMALAAASKLYGTTIATNNAATAAQATLDNSLGDANAYNFGSLVVGQGNALLNSVIQQPAFYQNESDAVASLGQTGAAGTADGTTAHHAVINLTADAPLLFWSLLSLGQTRKTTIAAAAIAGISAPVCTACGIEPFAVAAVSTADPVEFGFVFGTIYTLGYSCTGAAPALLAGTTVRVPYLIIDRFNTALPFTEDQQLFRVGANGLIPSTTPGQSCSIIGTTENLWATATTQAYAPQPLRTRRLRMPCAGPELTRGLPIQRKSQPARPLPTDVSGSGDRIHSRYRYQLTETDYTAYSGDNRRVMTLPVVDALSTTASHHERAAGFPAVSA